MIVPYETPDQLVVLGHGLRASVCGRCTAAAEHLIGCPRATPRGSNPMTSNLSTICLLKYPSASNVKSTPETPGPPGLTTSAPTRRDWSFALRRDTAGWNFSAHGFQWIASTPDSGAANASGAMPKTTAELASAAPKARVIRRTDFLLQFAA